MIKQITILIFIFLLFTRCDEGKIYPKETENVTGGKVTLNASFKDTEAWPQEYMLVLAACEEDEDLPIVSKIIPEPKNQGEKVSVTLNGIDERSKKIVVAIVNKGRQILYNYYTYPISDVNAEITLPIEEINLACYDRIQQQVFNAYCTRCHGAGDHAAANLYLTEGKSHKALVNVKAPLSETGKMLVKPNKAEESFLIDILNQDIIQYNHTDVLPENELVTLIKTWINKGAEE